MPSAWRVGPCGCSSNTDGPEPWKVHWTGGPLRGFSRDFTSVLRLTPKRPIMGHAGKCTVHAVRARDSVRLRTANAFENGEPGEPREPTVERSAGTMKARGFTIKGLCLVLTLAMHLALTAACGPSEAQKQAEEAKKQIEQAQKQAEEAAKKAQEAGKEAGKEVGREAGKNAQQAVQEASKGLEALAKGLQ